MHPNKKNFVDGLQLILDKWAALQLAVEMEWGGPESPQKADDLHYSLVDYFEKEGKNIEPEDLEEILYDVMRDEFGTVLEDQSEIEIAKMIWTLYAQCVKGETTLLQSLKSKPKLQNLVDNCRDETIVEDIPEDAVESD